ncbi:MAG: hypothetical protein EPN37_10135 [Chitinophagaceae bacterium]|jgi:mRNA-degrading endonuclease RelE of RelBE toxin-antitoxin system|nr:MAG: hypothetical protein EPN37_10135 [Chitinophagaceae bacterium]
MSYKVKSIAVFERQAKRLNKKYPSLLKDLRQLISELKENPEKGTPLGRNCFKIRLAIKSKGKGKSGGARIITDVVIIEETVYLLSIYDKGEQANISDKELTELLKQIPE